MQTKRGRFRNNFDWVLLAALAGLVAYGLLFLRSAQAPGSGRFGKQCLWVITGVAVMLGMSRADVKAMVKGAFPAYAVMLVLLVGVLFTRPVSGARSWFRMGPVSLQPSEFMKIVAVFVVTAYLTLRDVDKSFTSLLPPLLLVALPVGLILVQPDLGTATTFIPVVLAMLWVAGARLRDLGVLCGAGLGGAAVMWTTFMQGYQQRRILAWLHPEDYAVAEAWQLRQSMIAIGSGGICGKGIGQGTQNKLSLLPVKETDLIFSVVAEEWGLIGAILLVALFVLFIAAGYRIAARAGDRQTKLVAVGLVSLFAAQAIVNLWVAVGLLPTTGITLPFVSYGGSSMVVSFAAVGMLLRIGRGTARSIR